jgi:hypothetical protein
MFLYSTCLVQFYSMRFFEIFGKGKSHCNLKKKSPKHPEQSTIRAI